VIYTVRPGDTLNAIAQLVGASIEELVECNDLANPNALRVDQQLFVPELPSLFVTSTATPSITPTPSVTPTPRA
jgi:LysM repeat protein